MLSFTRPTFIAADRTDAEIADDKIVQDTLDSLVESEWPKNYWGVLKGHLGDEDKKTC